MPPKGRPSKDKGKKRASRSPTPDKEPDANPSRILVGNNVERVALATAAIQFCDAHPNDALRWVWICVILASFVDVLLMFDDFQQRTTSQIDQLERSHWKRDPTGVRLEAGQDQSGRT
jgi:hypothetical protein